MKEEILKVKEEIQKHIEESKTLQRLEEIRVNYMGKKGIFTDLSKKMKDLTAEERPKIGQIINEVKEKISNLLDEKNKALKEKELNESYKIGRLKDIYNQIENDEIKLINTSITENNISREEWKERILKILSYQPSEIDNFLKH